VPSQATPRLASPCLLLRDNCKRLDRATVRRGHVISAVSAMKSRNSRRAVFFRVSDRGFVGETEARLQGVLGGRQPRKIRSWRRFGRVI
jgi:hypothetical protein